MKHFSNAIVLSCSVLSACGVIGWECECIAQQDEVEELEDGDLDGCIILGSELEDAEPRSGRLATGDEYFILGNAQLAEAWVLILDLETSAPQRETVMNSGRLGEPLIALDVEVALPDGSSHEVGFGYHEQSQVVHMTTRRAFRATDADHEMILGFSNQVKSLDEP